MVRLVKAGISGQSTKMVSVRYWMAYGRDRVEAEKNKILGH